MAKIILLTLVLALVGCSDLAFRGVSFFEGKPAKEDKTTWKDYGVIFNFELFPGPKPVPDSNKELLELNDPEFQQFVKNFREEG